MAATKFFSSSDTIECQNGPYKTYFHYFGHFNWQGNVVQNIYLGNQQDMLWSFHLLKLCFLRSRARYQIQGRSIKTWTRFCLFGPPTPSQMDRSGHFGHHQPNVLVDIINLTHPFFSQILDAYSPQTDLKFDELRKSMPILFHSLLPVIMKIVVSL